MLTIQPKGGSIPVSFTHTDLVNYLIKNKRLNEKPELQSALLQIDRAIFIPPAIKHMAYQDRLLKVDFDEMMTNPSEAVTMLLELDAKPGGNYLHVGGGLGYVSSLLGFLAGANGNVYSLERIQWFWEKARQNFRNLNQQMNLEILYRDGNSGLADQGQFDGILASYIFKEPPHNLLSQLKIGGKLVFPTNTHTAVVWSKLNDENEYSESQVPNINSYAFGEGKDGLA